MSEKYYAVYDLQLGGYKNGFISTKKKDLKEMLASHLRSVSSEPLNVTDNEIIELMGYIILQVAFSEYKELESVGDEIFSTYYSL